MKKNNLILLVLLALITSCNDDNQYLNQESTNGFFINSEFLQINKAYLIPDLTTDKLDDFFIIVTDGEIISSLAEIDEFQFSDTTTNYVIFRGIQNPNTSTSLNSVPNGAYIFNSNNESFSYAQFNFNCEVIDRALQGCQRQIIINESINPNTAVIDIEFDPFTSNYYINYNIELPNSIKITGQYHGIMDNL